jgi:DNA polymerase-3 subunit delta
MNQPANVYLIFGEDEYLIEQALGKVLSYIEHHQAGEVTVETVDCRQTGVACVMEEIASPSLFSLNKVTVLKHCRLSGDSRLASELERCLRAGLTPGQYLVLVADKVDKRLKAVKAVSKQGELMEIGHLSRRGFIEWILDRFTQGGKKIEPSVAEMLAELKDDSLRAMDMEVEKLITYVGSRDRVTTEDVEALVGRSKTETIFVLIGQVIHGRIGEALETVGDLVRTDESPIGIVYLMARQVRWLIQIRLFLNEEGIRWDEDAEQGYFKSKVLPRFKKWIEARGISEADTFVRQHPYAVFLRFKEAAGFKLEDLLVLLDRLLDANVRLVSTSVEPKVILEQLVASVGTV